MFVVSSSVPTNACLISIPRLPQGGTNVVARTTRETDHLHASGGLPGESQVTRIIGHRQALEYLKRKNAKGNGHDALMASIDGFAAATRQYVTKQMQWFQDDCR